LMTSGALSVSPEFLKAAEVFDSENSVNTIQTEHNKPEEHLEYLEERHGIKIANTKIFGLEKNGKLCEEQYLELAITSPYEFFKFVEENDSFFKESFFEKIIKEAMYSALKTKDEKALGEILPVIQKAMDKGISVSANLLIEACLSWFGFEDMEYFPAILLEGNLEKFKNTPEYESLKELYDASKAILDISNRMPV
jgi:hypothetical protein